MTGVLEKIAIVAGGDCCAGRDPHHALERRRARFKAAQVVR